MHKAADQILSFIYHEPISTNSFQSRTKTDQKNTRNSSHKPTNETNLHNTDSEQLTYHFFFPRHCARFLQETVLRLQTFISACSGPADRAFGGSFVYRLLAFIPVAQHIVLSAVLTRVCRATLSI